MMSTTYLLSKYKDKIAKEVDKASEHVQSEGEILIKQLHNKQTNTKLNLNE